MIAGKIDSYFQKYPALKMLFFFDESREYEEEVKDLKLQDVCVEYFENNGFGLKWKLLNELNDQKVFIYVPQAQPVTQKDYLNFPLLGLLMANKALQLGDVGNFMEEFGLQRHQKSLVAKYMKELKYSSVQNICRPILSGGDLQEVTLQRALVSAFLKFKKMESWSLIIGKLTILSFQKDSKDLLRVIQKIRDLQFEDKVLEKIKDHTGIGIKELGEEALKDLLRGILYNKLTYPIETLASNDPYAKYKIVDNTEITRFNQMMHDIERSNLSDAFEEVLDMASKDIKGAKLIELYGDEANFAEFNTPMIWAILEKVQSELTTHPDVCIQKLDKISLQSDLKEQVKHTMDYLVQVSKVHAEIGAYDSYILDKPEDYLHQYTEQGYKVDTSYRRSINHFKNLDIAEIPASIDIDAIHAQLNKAYENHVDRLNREWLKCLAHFNFDYQQINVPKQYDFYKTEVSQIDQKVVVIISDALRYEAAAELLSEMHGDAKNTAQMHYMLASIPSKTNIGMSQLLPGDKNFNDGDILAGGVKTSGTENRSKILLQSRENSLAIQFSEVEGMNQGERRELFKKSLVYIYHDIIDSTGDKRASERRTFNAVMEAVNELKYFVNHLHATHAVTKVIVTADHGFLYNDKEIKEKEKENIGITNTLQSHNRFFLTQEFQDLELGYSFPLSATTQFKEELFVNIPYSVNRYKKQGVGHQFVHGGGSLQEIIVPVIESSRQRVDVTKKVTPMLINKGGMKIVSNILKVNVLQESPVSRMEKERVIKVGLYVQNNLVSNQDAITLNFTSESPSDRMVRVELILSQEAGSESFLKLKIFDEEDMLNPIIEERVQNNTLIQPDF